MDTNKCPACGLHASQHDSESQLRCSLLDPTLTRDMRRLYAGMLRKIETKKRIQTNRTKRGMQ
jgi:hypothetical protein